MVRRASSGMMVFVLCLTLSGSTTAEDWPQLGGPRRDGVSTETGLLNEWPQNGPKVVWEASGLGGGFAQPIVAAGRVFVMGRKTTEQHVDWVGQMVPPGPDVLTCLDGKSGKVVWRHEFPLHSDMTKSTAWCTPASAGPFVYARGGDGEVKCLSAADGSEVWSWPKDKELLKTAKHGETYEYAGGILLYDDLVVFQGLAPDGADARLVAVDKKSGETKWETPCKSWHLVARNPVVLTLRGKDFILVAGAALDAKTGEKVADAETGCWGNNWWKGLKDHLLVVAFEHDLKIPKEQEEAEKAKHGEGFQKEAGVQCVKYDLKEDGTLAMETAWQWSERGTANYESKGEKSYGGPVIGGNCVFVFLGTRSRGNRMVCLDLASGKELWRTRLKLPLGLSNPIYADGKVYYQSGGAVVMFAGEAKEFRQLGTAEVCEETWASPAISDGKMFVRDDYGNLKCLDIRTP